MRPLSPTAAIPPAFTRTRAVLFQPFRPGRSWKLSFCAYLALWGSLFFPVPIFPLLMHGSSSLSPFLTPLLWIGSAVFTAVMFGFYYLGSRMQFVLFDFVLSPSPLIAPLWRSRAAQTWRWIGLKLAITLPACAVVLVPLYPLIKRLFALMPMPKVPPQPPDPRLLAAFFSLYAVLAAAMSLLFLLASLLSDFVLPSLALEDASIAESLRRFGTLCQAEPLTLLGYVAMRILLAIVGFIGHYVATFITTLLAGVALGLVGFAGWYALHTVVPHPFLVVGAVALYLVFIVCLFYVQLGTFGVLIVFFRAYSLFFLGGRYPLLGNHLDPVLPPAAIPFPPPPPLSFSPQP